MSEKESYLIKYECSTSTNASLIGILSRMKFPSGCGKLRKDFHCTLLFADSWKRDINATIANSFELEGGFITMITRFEQFGKAIVGILDDENEIFKSIHVILEAKTGARSQFKDYCAHTTICYSDRQLSRQELDDLYEERPTDFLLVFNKITYKVYKQKLWREK